MVLYAIAIGVVAVVAVGVYQMVPKGTQVDRDAEAEILAAELVRVMSVLEIPPSDYELVSHPEICGWIPYEGPFAGTLTVTYVSSDENLELDRILREIPNGEVKRVSEGFSSIETPLGRFWAHGGLGYGFSFGANTDCYGS